MDVELMTPVIRGSRPLLTNKEVPAGVLIGPASQEGVHHRACITVHDCG